MFLLLVVDAAASAVAAAEQCICIRVVQCEVMIDMIPV